LVAEVHARAFLLRPGPEFAWEKVRLKSDFVNGKATCTRNPLVAVYVTRVRYPIRRRRLTCYQPASVEGGVSSMTCVPRLMILGLVVVLVGSDRD
jgi:hypothetical protein